MVFSKLLPIELKINLFERHVTSTIQRRSADGAFAENTSFKFLRNLKKLRKKMKK